MYDVAERWYTSKPSQRNRDDLEILERYEYTSDKYYQQKSVLVDNEKEVINIEKSISDERDKMKITSATLTDFERIMSMTYIDELVKIENERRLAKKIGNGVKSVDISMADSMKFDKIVEKVTEVVEPKSNEQTVQYQPPKPPRR